MFRWLFYFILITEFLSDLCTADSERESTESDDEFQICEICNTEEVMPSIFFNWLHTCIVLVFSEFLNLGTEEIATMFLLCPTGSPIMFGPSYD